MRSAPFFPNYHTPSYRLFSDLHLSVVHSRLFFRLQGYFMTLFNSVVPILCEMDVSEHSCETLSN